MTELTPEQIKMAVLQGLKDVAERFARNPTPTDGTIRPAVTEARAGLGGRPARKNAVKRRHGT